MFLPGVLEHIALTEVRIDYFSSNGTIYCAQKGMINHPPKLELLILRQIVIKGFFRLK